MEFTRATGSAISRVLKKLPATSFAPRRSFHWRCPGALSPSIYHRPRGVRGTRSEPRFTVSTRTICAPERSAVSVRGCRALRALRVAPPSELQAQSRRGAPLAFQWIGQLWQLRCFASPMVHRAPRLEAIDDHSRVIPVGYLRRPVSSMCSGATTTSRRCDGTPGSSCPSASTRTP